MTNLSVIESDYNVDFSFINKNRKPGVSGMMRIRNDAEFIEGCIKSCIDALDELIIVYNDCTDNSPEILEKIRCRYPDKIQVFEYKPWLYCGDLSDKDYKEAKNLPENSVHLLSNYYNFALSKTTCKYVMKIDSDQFYFTDRLKEICQLYRNRKILVPNILEIVVLGIVCLKRRISLYTRLSPKIYSKYNNCIKKLISTFGITTSYSGVNVVFDQENNILVPLGKETSKLNILMPFNGVGDHLIFRVKQNTRFVPFDCKDYNVQTSRKNTYIEKLVGYSHPFLNGFLWWHLNGVRENIYATQKQNILKHPDSFMSLKECLKESMSAIVKKIQSTLLDQNYTQMMDINKRIFFPTLQHTQILEKYRNR